MLKIKFRGKEYIATNLTDSFIATKEQYENGLCSFAHIHPDGSINRFGKIIGWKEDIEVIGEIEVNIKRDAIFNMLDWAIKGY